MTTAADKTPVTETEMVTLTIDDVELSVPVGTLVIRAAELIGIEIPRFCDHPLLDPVGACRQCLVDVEGQRKPLASCTTVATDGMVVRTQHTSEAADRAQHGVMELLLINHPLDCPVCDKGGECPLQNQAMSSGRPDSRFEDVKRTFPKPINISSQVLLDRERCVLCARCTRFSNQIAGDPFIELLERGALQQVGIYTKEPFDSYFSGNAVQICPVGALTGSAYRFRARPFDLVSSPSVCEHCASGCSQRTDHRRGKVLRRLSGDDPEVNEEWNCDKGRWAFTYATQRDRITTPLIRDEDGQRPASWSEALAVAVKGLSAARGNTGVLVGGHATLEDAYAYGKFARAVLGTNDIDFRSRALSAEEADFLGGRVAGKPVTVSYSDLERAPAVLLAGFEPEDESPIVYLRLRKAARTHHTKIYAVAPFATRGLEKMAGTLLQTAPGGEAAKLAELGDGELAETLSAPGAVIMVGERLASCPGALSAAAALADSTGAQLAWVPRRAGERAAVDGGAIFSLLPGGRPITDATAQEQLCSLWNITALPSGNGRDTRQILDDAEDLGALVVGGIELADLPDPAKAAAALDSARFVVSLEIRQSAVTDRADVVFPVAPVVEKAGTFLNWEGRYREFEPALQNSGALPDCRVLHMIADEMGVEFGLPHAAAARDEFARLPAWDGPRPESPNTPPGQAPSAGSGAAILASWRMLLDAGRSQDGEPHLAGTRRPAVARMSPATATEIGAAEGEPVTVSTAHGDLTLPLTITDMPDRVVWLPMNSPGSAVHEQLRVSVGAVVSIAAGQQSGEGVAR